MTAAAPWWQRGVIASENTPAMNFGIEGFNVDARPKERGGYRAASTASWIEDRPVQALHWRKR